MTRRSAAQVRADATSALVQDVDLTDTLATLLSDCADVLPAAAVGLLVRSDAGEIELLSATSHAVAELELYQIQQATGPCIDAMAEDSEITARWPGLGGLLVEAGYQGVHASPMRWHGQTLGALNAFFTGPLPLTRPQRLLAQGFADVATLVLMQAVELSGGNVGGRIRAALAGRTVVELAKGVIAQQDYVDMSTAYGRLIRMATHSNESLSAVAEDVVRKVQREPPAEKSSPSNSPDGGHLPAGGTLVAHDSYRHEAFLWEGEDEFLAGTVPFILEGLRAGQPVMVAVIAPRIDLLRAALGGDADLVHFVDMVKLGSNPARIIPGWLQFIKEYSPDGQPVRGIGEPIWSGRRPEEIAECQLHEALLNLAVDPQTPLWLLCPYDVENLAPDVITEASRSHPVLVEGEHRRRSTLYGGSGHAGLLFEKDLPAVELPASHLSFGRDDLLSVREDLIVHSMGAGLSAERSTNLTVAVLEIATNSAENGSGPAVLRIWLEHDSLVCEVTHGGFVTDPLLGRTTPAGDDERGCGLWMANQLCDLVQVRSGAKGTTIRVHTLL